MELNQMRIVLDNKLAEIRVGLTDSEAFPIDLLINLAKDIYSAFNEGHKIAFVGNGGSAAEAMHLAAEFTGKCIIDHDPLPALCLNESQSAITAIANDYGVEEIFARQVKAHMGAGDILIAMSTSGKSPNVLKALEACTELGVRPILWSGRMAVERPKIEVWRAPSKVTPRIQEFHLMWGHLISELVEEMLPRR